MKDPYSVLGVPRTATDEEIKKAYRALAKKYHPDNYAGNSAAELAEEKMKEINDAYDRIQKERAGDGPAHGGYTYEHSGSTSFAEVRRLIHEGRYADAELIIDSTPANDRGAEWNYLKGCLLTQRGLYYDALKFIEIACYLDPANPEYRDAKNRMKSRSGAFGQEYTTMGSGGACDCCDVCTTLLCADACCECCGGDLIGCC